MNRAEISAGEVPPPSWSENAGAFALKVLAEIGRDNWDLSILLCGDTTIRELNARYRNRNEATDVLSFALGAEIPGEDGGKRLLPGDIVISLDTLRENAQNFHIPEDEELRRLLIHGILHLDGMDHATNDAAEPMIMLQEKILEKLAEEHIMSVTAPSARPGERGR
jgi:probable rRNA maturation factor